jgi:hypothetical protein
MSTGEAAGGLGVHSEERDAGICAMQNEFPEADRARLPAPRQEG